MPTLEWIGKDKVINHHLDVPYRVLEEKYTFNKEGTSENKIIHGDNLAALKSLLPEYEGRIDCIYIDPPYNTGNEGWVYNDNVNDPRIKEWFKKVVGKEGEDLSRHDKWLCMMYPRLRLLQMLLNENGKLIISIGYHELSNLVSICKEIFSASKQIVVVTVQTSGGKPSAGFNYLHEYLVFIVPKDFKANTLDFCGGNARNPYEGLTLSTFSKVQRPNQTYPIFVDSNGKIVGVGKSLRELINSGEYVGKIEDFSYDYNIAPDGCVAVWPVTTEGKECVWRQIPKRIMSDLDKGYIKVTLNNKKSMNKNKYSVQYLPKGVINKISSGELMVIGHDDINGTLIFGDNETVGGQIPTLWLEKEFYTVKGTNSLHEIFSEISNISNLFNYSKSPLLIENIIHAISTKSSIILDSFAGSGTTAHAVLNLNKTDSGNRKFILIEMEDYAETTTAERVRRVINGYGDTEGTSGDFTYYELGDVVLHPDKTLNENLPIEKIQEYIWITETHTPYRQQNKPYYLGKANSTAYYFIYEKGKSTTLDYDFLSQIQEKEDSYVIYADTCMLSEEELLKYNITFKKIPRDITTL